MRAKLTDVLGHTPTRRQPMKVPLRPHAAAAAEAAGRNFPWTRKQPSIVQDDSDSISTEAGPGKLLGPHRGPTLRRVRKMCVKGQLWPKGYMPVRSLAEEGPINGSRILSLTAGGRPGLAAASSSQVSGRGTRASEDRRLQQPALTGPGMLQMSCLICQRTEDCMRVAPGH